MEIRSKNFNNYISLRNNYCHLFINIALCLFLIIKAMLHIKVKKIFSYKIWLYHFLV